MQNNLTFKILKPNDKSYSDAVDLAEEILRKPLNLKFSDKELETEKQNIRIAGFFEDTICATAMLSREDDKIFMQRVAVAKEMQNKGIGSQLLKFCEEFTQENEARVIYAHARDGAGRSAINFYTKNEYFCGDEEFFEDGIAHKIVWKILP